MSLPVVQRPRARLDLLAQFVYFGEQGGTYLAERYLAAIEATCLLLAHHPQSGILYDSGIAKLKGIRRVPIKGFKHHLLFYVPRRNHIDVIRVVHGTRDIESLFGREET